MRPLVRRGVNKGASAKKFCRNVSRTKAANLPGLSRGGIRL